MLRRLINLWAWSDIEPIPHINRGKKKIIYPEDLPSIETSQGIIIDTRNPVETLDIT